MINKLKDFYYKKIFEHYSNEYNLEKALFYLKKISSSEKQVDLLHIQLSAYAISNVTKYQNKEVKVFTDVKEYERFKELVGDNAILINPDNEEVDVKSIDEIINNNIQSSHPYRIFLDEIKTK